jgi:small subunit ribosomal protein S5
MAEYRDSEYIEKIVQIRRVTKVVKGGKNLSFRAVVVIGNESGKVGVGLGKSKEVPVAIRKAITAAKKNLVNVEVINGTLPHDTVGKLGASKVFIRPAPKGTGVIAGGVSRIVLELAGYHNVVSKSLGASSIINNAFATVDGLSKLKKLSKVREDRGVNLSVKYIS